ncbi:MAG: protein kinase [Cyanobacteria bacterium SZAS TMP-1]|nr:protein kinase [Cyanobacteria bacterium SZAS TMP-1]
MADSDNDNDNLATRAIPGSGQTTQIPGISGTNVSYLPGDIVDNAYQLTKLLGSGGMGAVFACRHLALNQNYALKLLSARDMSGESWSRFQVEAKALARLNHPGIVTIYNMGIDKNQCPYYVMDLLSGEGLNTMIERQGPLPYQQALDIFIQVAEALGSAHAQGIVHRDIKPSNLMLQKDQASGQTRVKLVDFGIARVSKEDGPNQSQTATGLIFGTPFYMSPEQCDGARVDGRSDIYSIGCALFETLTGRPPFVGESAVQTLMLHQNKPAPTLKSRARDLEFPEALEFAVQKMLKKRAAERYQDMSQLKHDLERIRQGKPILAQGLTGASEAAPIKINLPERQATVPPTASGITTPIKLAIAGGLLVILAASTIITIALTNKPQKKIVTSAAGSKSAPYVASSPASNFAGDTLDWINEDKSEKKEEEDERSYFGIPVEELRGYGATEAELKEMDTSRLAPLKHTMGEAKRKLETFFAGTTLQAKFKEGNVFHFPRDVSLGDITIGDAPPRQATGDIPVPAGARTCLYLATPTKGLSRLLSNFGPDDLNGIAILFDASDFAIGNLTTWKKLDDLWFFNPLMKMLPTDVESMDEADFSDNYLYKLEQLKHLKSLGLSKPVSGAKIVGMPLLRRLECLRIKRIYEPEALYRELHRFDNLKELWIMHQDTTDDQLHYFAAMKNLQRLTIKRSHLTFAAAGSFKKMPALKYLFLDRNDWTAEQKAHLKKMLPHCRIVFENVIDRRYWEMLPPGSASAGKVTSH